MNSGFVLLPFALPVAVAATEYLYTRPPLAAAPGRIRYLWHAVMEVR